MKRLLSWMAGTAAGMALAVCTWAGDPARTPATKAPPEYGQVVVVRSPPEIMTVQRLPNFVGISGSTVGAKALSMNLVVIPPGAQAEPHRHVGFESAVYVFEGRVETRWGEKLEDAIRQAIETCHDAGGGRVVIPRGSG